MIEEFDIKTFRPEAVNELADFLREEYPTGEIAEEKYLSWEYLDNPAGKAIVTTARNEEMNIVSQYSLSPMIVQVDGLGVTATLSLNTLTAEKYRGKGLFQSTASKTFSFCAANAIAFTYGIPNRNSFPGFIRRLNFTHAGNLVFMAKPLKPLKILTSMLNRRYQKKGEPIEFYFDKDEFSKDGVSELVFPGDKGLYYDFINLWNKQQNISIQRGSEYLKWRYVENPLRNYAMFKLSNHEGMSAMAVVRTMHLYGLKVCVVMEHLSLSKWSSLGLLKAIARQTKKNNMDLMIAVAASKKNNQYVQLRYGGFRPVPAYLLPQQLPFIIRIHNDQINLGPKLNDLKNWHFSFGDYDVF